ncbi:hypothetical protein [uncultured Jatrophihabitans sp.]|uniref:hypothetical protein n=1 Tax=uncultured Jatrophihabitans sp. TaxID=1610747 RepID=UPI0035CBBD6D
MTADGYVRVSSTGTSTGIRRTLVADLSLAPSILSYGYYTDYETLSPAFLTDYNSKHSIYLSNSTTYSKVSSTYRGSTSVPQTVSWKDPTGTQLCGEHWYRESATIPGRAADTTVPTQTGSLITNRTSPSATLGCDLVFTTGMIEDGKTYTRDAIDVSNGSGNGPIFNQPVYTLWGYNDGHENFTSPSNGGQPWRGDSISSSSLYKPVVAPYDLTLPPTIGSDGLATNACVYYGPTRVVLNGDGTATVTSPSTTVRDSGSDVNCYPSGSLDNGIRNFQIDYATVGGSTVYVKNLGTAPATGWPDNPTKLTNTPAANNEVFWLPVSGVATPDSSTSAAPSTCANTSTQKYSAAVNAQCAWTNVATSTDASSTTGWTAYTTSSTTGTNCAKPPAATDQLLFQCEYNHSTSTSAPSTNAYAAVRSTMQSFLNSNSCATGLAAAFKTCLQTQANSALSTANTSQHPFNYTSPANGDHQYAATVTLGTPVTGSTQNVGSAPANPTAGDTLFSYTGTPGQEQSTLTPVTTTVYRQTYSSTSKSWSAGTAQFTFTTTHNDWVMTAQPSGASYFPQLPDVTDYNSGTTSGSPSVAVGSTGNLQPGDLYIQGRNNGQLSVLAQNDIIATGDITDTGTTGSDTQAVDLVAGKDVRNYHPVSCVDTNATDINNTSPGWCPNDISDLTSSSLQNSDGSFTAQAPQLQYQNMTQTGDHTIDAAIFTLSGSFRTDNYDRAPWVGNVLVNGGLYQSHRGGNGTTHTYNGNTVRTGLSLNYTYVDLERANLPYAPPASNSANPRPWNVVSISAGGP